MTNLIDENNISVDLLKELADSVFIDYESVSDNALLFKMSRKVIIQILPHKKSLVLAISYSGDENTPDKDRMDYLNEINMKLPMVSAYFDHNKDISFNYTHHIEGGVTSKNIIRAIRAFDEIVGIATSFTGFANLVK